MGNRLSKIYTRTGDDGTTGLGDGSRIAKDSVRVEAYGTVDEANSAIGVVLAVPSVPVVTVFSAAYVSPTKSDESAWARNCASHLTFPVVASEVHIRVKVTPVVPA